MENKYDIGQTKFSKVNILSRNFSFSDLSMIIYFSATPILSFLSQFGLTNSRLIILTLVLATVYFLSFFEALSKKEGKYILPFIIIVTFTGLFAGVTYYFTPSLRPWILDNNWGVINRVFLLHHGIFATYSILINNNINRFIENLKVPVIINFVYRLMHFLQFLIRGHWVITDNQGLSEQTSNYSMGFGYAMTTIFVIAIIIYLVDRNKIYLLVSSISLVLAFLYGSRGVILIIFTFLSLYILTQDNIKIKTQSYLLLNLLFSAFITYLVVNFSYSNVLITINLVHISFVTLLLLLTLTVRIKNNLILILTNAYLTVSFILLLYLLFNFESFGNINELAVNSRTLSSIITGDILDQNGRDVIWALSFEGFKESLPLGLGFFGDRLVIGPFYAWGYSHNIFLEILVTFGLLGIAIIFTLVYMIAKCFILTKDNVEEKLVLIGFLSMSTRLLISDSFWYSMEFWGLVGIIMVIVLNSFEKSEHFEK